MADAEVYLTTLGIPAGLPKLPIRFGDRIVDETNSGDFRVDVDDFLQIEPTV